MAFARVFQEAGEEEKLIEVFKKQITTQRLPEFMFAINLQR